MVARDSQSYPWLAISQHCNVPYGKVLAAVEALDAGKDILPPYIIAETRWLFELQRRWREYRHRR